jgi:hypothetical protein
MQGRHDRRLIGRMKQLPALKPASSSPQPCKICSGPAALFGVVDFNKQCEEQNGFRLPLSGVPVYYRRCKDCGFLFTDAFDDWSIEEFRTHIYNDDYLLCDPEYAQGRPVGNAGLVEKFWGERKQSIRVLDYGGGNDALCATLRARGFPTAISYDPIVPEYARRPEGKFDIVTCFETLEHMPDPVAGIGKIVEFAAEPGLVFYSTFTQPDNIEACGLNWWYVAPRNGHISLFSQRSLAVAWSHYGYKTIAFNNCAHFAFRTLPSYLAHLEAKVDDLAVKGSSAAA